MAYLLYCIVHGGRDDLVFPDATIRVRRAGLAAVVSEVFPDPDDLKSTVENLLAYACVIERYDRERSVIPMRFGCVFQTLGQLSEGIERRQEEITALLTKLDRRTEMSARILVDRPSIPA